MYTKLICALMVSTMLFSCNKKENKSSINEVGLSPVEKITTNNILKKTDEEIPVAGETLLADTTTTGVQTKQQPTSTKPVQASIPPDWNKKIIKTSAIKLEVKNFKTYNDFLYNKVKQYGGYIAQEDNNLTDEKSETVVSIKVPVQFFDGLMNDLTNADTKVLEKSIKSEDVTGDVVDTRSRLEAKKQMRLKYLEFLKLSKNMSEVLQVQQEINNIQEEIESATGRFASLTSQAAYSTINLTFFQPSVGFKPVDASPSFFSKTAEAFSIGTTWISNLFIALISIWPLLAALAIALFVYKKRRPAKLIQQKL